MIFYCINLPDRPDKREHVQSEFDRVGILPTYYNSVRTKPGKVGCRNAHLDLLKNNEGVFAIFEDDAQFIFGTLDWVYDCMKELPSDWDALYLGGSPQKLQSLYSGHLFNTDGVKVTHAIIWHKRENGAVNWIIANSDSMGDLSIDRFFAEVVQPKFNFYIVYPMMCTQRQSQSDTCRYADYSSILRNYNKYCK